jgi:hypothetical protein
MIQQDLRSVNGYVLGLVGLVLALFIPFTVFILAIFNSITATLFLEIFLPLAALILGIIGLIKTSKQTTSFTKAGKILSISAIIIGAALVVFNVFVFIKSGGLSAI